MNIQSVPNFIIAGAPRSGTTWVYHLLDKHPEIYMAKPVSPEPKFFLVDELFEKGMTYYLKTWFSNAPENVLCGEKSTNYLESPVAATRIHSKLPDVKLIFILREPVERAFSNYRWSKMNGMEDQSFSSALALERSREDQISEKLQYARPHAYFSRGLYANQLQRFFDLFPQKQILCLRFEDMIENPECMAARLHRFLGVAKKPSDVSGLGVINPSIKSKIPEVTRRYLLDLYLEPNKKLAKLLGPEFKMWEK